MPNQEDISQEELDLLDQFEKYENKWVAMTAPDRKIVGSGDDAVSAKRDAENNGYRNIILLKVFSSHTGYIPAA